MKQKAIRRAADAATGQVRRARRMRRPAGALARAAAALVMAVALAGCSASRGGDDDDASDDRAPCTGIRLVLQITVDQLRSDVFLQTRDRWGPGGFRRLYDDGVVFADAHHAHANTETAVGHATLATGADPAVHGMVGNTWFDSKRGELRNNVEDARFLVVGYDGRAAEAAGHPEVPKKSYGRSPEMILAPAIADSIVAAGGDQAKVFSISLKDRSAVPMGGHKGKALWWSDATGGFISSTYYYEDRRLPRWIRRWNAKLRSRRAHGRSWKLLLDRSTYRAANLDNMPWESPPPGMGRTFPHQYHWRVLGSRFFPAIAASPYGDEVLFDFARTMFALEELGRDEVPDYLSVAFSSTDYIGHRYGPSSLEYEDELLRLDRVIARLLDLADRKAGRECTVVVFSSDHGVAEPVEERLAAGRDAGHIELSSVLDGPVVRELAARHGGRLVRTQWPPYVYLDRPALEARGVDPETIARAIAAEFEKLPGVEAALTRGQILDGSLPDTAVVRAVRRNFHPDRSGDIHVVPRPGWQISYETSSSAPYATGHGTPWDYDSRVPLVFVAPGLEPAVVDRRVESIDVAPTLAELLGVEVPSRSQGKALLARPAG